MLKAQRLSKPVAENVVETCRGTVIASGDLKISTIEHAMAALYASMSTTASWVNGPEVPILDGSAKIFMDKIEEVGVVEQTEDAAVYVVRNRTTVKDSETEASICVIPDSDFCVDVMIEFNSVVLSISSPLLTLWMISRHRLLQAVHSFS